MKDRSSGASDLAGEAYVIIRERILRGEVAIGQVISRRKIAAELGMSFLPVSEAFLRLEFEGLLESRPRAGTRVRIPSREDVRGHYLVREALEVEAARLFSEMATLRNGLSCSSWVCAWTPCAHSRKPIVSTTSISTRNCIAVSRNARAARRYATPSRERARYRRRGCAWEGRSMDPRAAIRT